MLILATMMAVKVVMPEPGLSLWWENFSHAFNDVWVYGPGAYLFVLEPVFIIVIALIAQIICKLKPKTIWSGPGLLLGNYMFFWFQPVVYGLVTGNEWEPVSSILFTTPLVLSAGQVLLAKRGFKVDWSGALRFALVMLITYYAIGFLFLLSGPNID
jgi:hypothetical protein